jgi:hypothetical protein
VSLFESARPQIFPPGRRRPRLFLFRLSLPYFPFLLRARYWCNKTWRSYRRRRRWRLGSCRRELALVRRRVVDLALRWSFLALAEARPKPRERVKKKTVADGNRELRSRKRDVQLACAALPRVGTRQRWDLVGPRASVFLDGRSTAGRDGGWIIGREKGRNNRIGREEGRREANGCRFFNVWGRVPRCDSTRCPRGPRQGGGSTPNWGSRGTGGQLGQGSARSDGRAKAAWIQARRCGGRGKKKKKREYKTHKKEPE